MGGCWSGGSLATSSSRHIQQAEPSKPTLHPPVPAVQPAALPVCINKTVARGKQALTRGARGLHAG